MSTLKVNNLQDINGANNSTPEQMAQGRAKAWINFTGSGTVAIKDSFNVSSITDNGVGHYGVTFSNNMANDDYAWSFVTGVGMWNGNEGYATTTTLRLRNMTRNDSYTNADSDINACVVFGDQ